MKTLTASLVALSLILSSGNRQEAREGPTPGAVKLLEGFRHEPLQGIDSRVGRIWKKDGLSIRYDIGALAGNWAERLTKEERLWSLSQTVAGRSLTVAKKKDGHVFVSFPKRKSDEFMTYPANFYAEVHSESELAELLLTALTYPQSKKEASDTDGEQDDE